MKLPQLLSQFLYQAKKLDLPGIGSFTLDPSVIIPAESDKSLQTIASGITFKNTIIREPEDALILFIKEHTGKMKPLAASDLDFFLTTGKQLLNIGKPFHLDGIGTLIQNKEGKLDFTPGEYSTAKLETDSPEKKEAAEKRKTSFEETGREYEPRSNTPRQAILLAAIIGGLIVIGWGGYTLYKRNTFTEPPPQENVVAPVTKDSVAQRTEPATRDSAKDTLVHAAAPPVTVAAPGMNPYKFIILETDRKGKALRRYNQLLGFQLNIKMETRDSSSFKLYFPIAAFPRDTTHIKDSLADIYAAHVRIERP